MEITDELYRQYKASHLNKKEFAKKIGVNQHSFRRDINEFEAAEGYLDSDEIVITETDDEVVARSNGETIRSLDDLLQVCDVDLSVWRVDHYKIKIYQGSRKEESKDLEFRDGKITGTIFDTGKLTPTTMYSVIAWFVPRQEEEVLYEQLVTAQLERLRNETPVSPEPPMRGPVGDHLLVMGFFDVHFGRRDTMSFYTLERAKRDFLKASRAMLDRAVAAGFAIGEILIPIGNDAAQADNQAGTTTDGTRQDTNADHRDIVNALVEVYTKQIEMCRKVAPVVVKAVEGNHDRLTAFMVARVLEATFAHCPDVTIDNGKSPRKYHLYGKTLIGMEHGDKVKPSKLAQTMAAEADDYQSKGQYHIFLRGHFHTAQEMFSAVTTEMNITIITYPAFCPPSQWELMMAFVGSHRAAEARFYHFEHGPAAVIPIFVDELVDIPEEIE